MNQRARIICATDLLPRSDAAVERAGLLADSIGADLTLLHVVAPSESERVLEQALQQAQSMLRSRAQPPMWHGARLPNTAIRTGNPIRLVVDEVGKTGKVLIFSCLVRIAVGQYEMFWKAPLPRGYLPRVLARY